MQSTDSSGISRRGNNYWRITHRWEDKQYFTKRRSLQEFIPKSIMSTKLCTVTFFTVCKKIFTINSFIFGNLKTGCLNMNPLEGPKRAVRRTGERSYNSGN
jgi:hypothetical protein